MENLDCQDCFQQLKYALSETNNGSGSGCGSGSTFMCQSISQCYSLIELYCGQTFNVRLSH